MASTTRDAPAHAENIINVVIGTAGHIDHGKSLLVRRLTGIDPDRLKEEQERGITIDLGFAPLVLADGLRVGIIDVPGHERFVKNMIAGATGIDMVLLVVAADDGVMPQTREHIEIIGLLGVGRGIVAITKIDLVDEEMIELVEEDVRDLLVGTPMERAKMLRVSSMSGQGVDELREAIESEVARIERKAVDGPFRMPIQRVFSKAGFGAVVTGVPLSGTLGSGDEVEILPVGLTGRVKGMQAYQGGVDHARAGHSTALNLAGIDYKEVRRGHVAAEPGIFRAVRLLEARLHVLAGTARPLVHRTPIRFHAGTVEVLGRVLMLEADAIEAGGSALVQLALDDPVVVAPGDRFVLRRQSPVTTLAGGVILSLSGRRLRRGRPAILDDLGKRERYLTSPARHAAHLLSVAGRPMTLEDLSRELASAADEVSQIANGLVGSRRAIRLSEGRMLVAPNVLAGLREKILGSLEEYFRANPRQQSMPLPTVRASAGLSDEMAAAVLGHLAAQGDVDVSGNRVSLAGRGAELTEQEQELLGLLEALYREARFQTPSVSEAAEAGKSPEKTTRALLDLMVERGTLVRAGGQVYFHAEAVAEALKQIDDLAGDEPFTTSDLRKRLGTSRKYIIPLLEHLDSTGHTARRGAARIRTRR